MRVDLPAIVGGSEFRFAKVAMHSTCRQLTVLRLWEVTQIFATPPLQPTLCFMGFMGFMVSRPSCDCGRYATLPLQPTLCSYGQSAFLRLWEVCHAATPDRSFGVAARGMSEVPTSHKHTTQQTNKKMSLGDAIFDDDDSTWCCAVHEPPPKLRKLDPLEDELLLFFSDGGPDAAEPARPSTALMPTKDPPVAKPTQDPPVAKYSHEWQMRMQRARLEYRNILRESWRIRKEVRGLYPAIRPRFLQAHCDAMLSRRMEAWVAPAPPGPQSAFLRRLAQALCLASSE